MEYLTHLSAENPLKATKSKHSGLAFTFPVKYYDFHVYYHARVKSSVQESDNLRDKLLNDFQEEAADGSILVKKLPDDRVIGPHVTQFWEVDVARPEVFVKVLSWFQLYHGNLSVLIHPQTGDDLLDHTDRALWLGEKLPVLTEVFTPDSAGIPEFGVKGGKRIAPELFDLHVPTL